LTKHTETIKCPTDENQNITKINYTPQHINNTPNIYNPNNINLNTDEILIQPKTHPTKITPKTQLEKITHHLYNLENHHKTEKTLNIELNLYQMEEP